MNGIDSFFQKAEAKVVTGLSKEQEKLAKDKKTAEETKTSLHRVLKERKRREGIGTTMNWPTPYNKFGGEFNEKDITDHLDRVYQIQDYLEKSERIDQLEEELHLLENIGDMKRINEIVKLKLELEKPYILEHESSIEALAQEKKWSEKTKEIKLKKLMEEKEEFLHYTILSYLGYCKSLKYNLKLSNESVPTEIEEVIKITEKLAFKTALDAVKKYNPHIKTEEDLKKHARHETTDLASLQTINKIAHIFTIYFLNDNRRNKKYYEAMQYVEPLLSRFEHFTDFPACASKIPKYFMILRRNLINGHKN